MIKNYYIQKGSDIAKDIFSEYGIIVMATKGLNQLPEIKSPFSRDWSDEQGDDVYFPSTTFFKSKEVTLTFRLQKDTVDDIKAAIKSFLEYIIPNGAINYFDTYRKDGFRGYYNKEKLIQESYRVTGSYIEWDMEFTVPNGICFGFDNTGNSRIFVDIIGDTSDIYFSDGSYSLEVAESFIKDLVGGFVIICPSIYGGTSLTGKIDRVLGISGKVLGINGKVLGI